MSACKQNREKVLLYFYNELEQGDRFSLESHFQICPDCSRELQQLRSINGQIPQKPLIDFNESNLQALRNELSQKIYPQQFSKIKNKPGFFLFSFIAPKPAFQFGFAVLLLAFGFLLGSKTSFSKIDKNQNAFLNIIAANRQIQAANGEINPFLASVEKVKYNPNTGSVEIYYTTVNDIQLNGDLNNLSVRQMLTHAMLEEENPTVRLHAVKVLQVLADEKKYLEPELIDSIESLLEKESNLGIRLQALRLLNQFPFNATVKNILSNIILHDPEPAMRIQAFETLTRKNQGIGNLLEVTKNDTNEYLKYHSEKLLGKTTDQAESRSEKLMRKE